MSAQNTPTSNEFGLRLAGRHHARRIGLHQGLGASPLSRDLHGGDGSEDPRVNRQARERIINFHISNINAMRRAKGMPELSAGDHARIHAAAEQSSGASSESIMQAVLTAANAAVPLDAQTLLRQQLAQKGIDEPSYFAALAKHGATLGSFEALIAAAQRMRNSVSGADIERISSSSGYSGNIGVISMSNYTTAGSPFYATGMTYGTFNYLRNYSLPDGSRFSGANILHASQDAARQQFSPNDQRATRNLATLDRYDPAGREIRNRLAPEVRRRTSDDPRSRELLEELRRANTPEARAAVHEKIEAHKRLILEQSGWNNHVRGLPAAAQRAGADHGRHLIEDQLKKLTNDPTVRTRLEEERGQSERRADQQPTPEQIQRSNQALLQIAGSDPEKLAAAHKLIEMGAADRVASDRARVEAERARSDVDRARIAGSRVDDVFGSSSAAAPSTGPAAPSAPEKKADAMPTTPPAKEPDKPAPQPAATSPAAKKDEPKKIAAAPSGRAAGPV